MTNPSIKKKKKTSLVPSSSSCSNNASLAGSYLSLMFCAFPKPLSKGSGLSLRVTSNDNLFVVICVQTTRDIQNSNIAFLKKSKSIKKLSFVKQVLLSKNKKKCQRETRPPCPTIQHAEQLTGAFTSARWFDASTHTQAIHSPRIL